MTSQINPNNIDGNYPVAGQPNNTQGMRDNFTGTKTNFQYAASEINDLQSKSVLKSALTGGTLDNNMNDNLIYAVQLSDVSYKELQLTATSGSITLDYAAAMYQAMPTTSGSVSLDFSNWPTSGSVGALRFAIVITNTAYTLTLPASVSIGIKSIPGISPGTPGVTNTITYSATGTYIYEFLTSNNGTTISVQDLVNPPANFTNVLTVANTTPSTTTSTGAIVTTGGVGVAGNIYAGGNVVATGNVTSGNLITGGSISVTGSVVLSGTGTIGYGVGAGGTVSQSGNKSGGVTLNEPSGEITMQNTALGAATIVSFVLTNSTIAATDVLVINHVSGGTVGSYTLNAACAAGSATIYVRNATSGSLSEALVLRYAVIKGATS